MAINFDFPQWMLRQNTFADSLAKGAQVGAAIANARYRNQALAAQAVQSEREFALREKQLESHNRTADLNFQLQSQLIEDQMADKATSTEWIRKRNALPLKERVEMPLPENVRLTQTYGILNQIADNDRMVYERSLEGQLASQFAARVGKLPPSFQRRFQLAAGSPEEQDRILEEGEAAAIAKTFPPGALEKDIEYLIEKFGYTKEKAEALAQAKFLGAQMRLRTPEGLEIDYGASDPTALATPTTAFRTQLQQQLHSHDTSMAALAHIEKNIDASDFGLRGMAKELRSKIGGQLGMDIDPKDMDVRNSLKQLRQDLFKSLRSDSNIAEGERKIIEGMLPEVEMFDVVESLPSAVGKLMTVKRRLQESSRSAAQKLGVLPPLWTLSNDEIATAVKAGQLNRDEALRFLMENR